MGYLIGDIGNYLGGLTSGGLLSSLNTTAASTNYVNTYYLGLQQIAASQATPPIQQAAPMPVVEDEVGWLRRRVSEVCWQ